MAEKPGLDSRARSPQDPLRRPIPRLTPDKTNNKVTTASHTEVRTVSKRPGYFAVTRPDELWHMDMTSVWVAEHGWVYLNAIIDCCTREIVASAIDVRCRATEALAVVDHAVAARSIEPDTLTLGTDNGTAYTSRAFRARLSELGIGHRRGGYRDPESQAFIESWFSKLKLRCVWREEFETIDEARTKINTYINNYHHRPHSGLGYKTPAAVAATWKDHDRQLTPAA